MPIDQLELLLEDPSIREALAVVYERSNGGSDELDWSDVRDALSSDQWGRLIEREVLVSAGTGFAIADPERVRTYLDECGTDTAKNGAVDGDEAEDVTAEGDAIESAHPETIESPSWTTADKAAGAFALLLFAGYWSASIRDIVAVAESAAFGPITDLVPFHLVIVLLAIVTGIYSTALQSRLLDREKLQEYQRRMQRLRERREAATDRGDDEALERIREEQRAAAGDQLGMFKVQFRPMVWIMLLTIPVFLWLRWKVRGGHLGPNETGLVVPIAGAVTWQEPLAGPLQTWLAWYLCCSIAARQLIQKLFRVGSTASSSSSSSSSS
ncbi:DUF106 domain-containing protein [Natrinema salifodinae]|uniref:Uncharacterized membrane protein, DUF106 family n=1 Tax=Natrinema salifodinae TaxID=1202768 RepID=A0A1I0QJY3_9EURY|nr:DUF106 domain-containing protein [Natrinema salifodinae]SEW27433.1 Uncharacterized membrane protein, DUF106 family [Natrinema salifodinae]